LTRHECTKEDPWTPEKGPRAAHTDIKRIGGDDNYFESYSIYKCNVCGTEFTVYYEE
jgi:transposase-like protein